jgi:hypothetical protein
MPASYLPYLPDQDFLLPHSMREWLHEGHLAYFKNVLGSRKFSMRGLHRVQAGFKLVSLALNLRAPCRQAERKNG